MHAARWSWQRSCPGRLVEDGSNREVGRTQLAPALPRSVCLSGRGERDRSCPLALARRLDQQRCSGGRGLVAAVRCLEDCADAWVFAGVSASRLGRSATGVRKPVQGKTSSHGPPANLRPAPRANRQAPGDGMGECVCEPSTRTSASGSTPGARCRGLLLHRAPCDQSGEADELTNEGFSAFAPESQAQTEVALIPGLVLPKMAASAGAIYAAAQERGSGGRPPPHPPAPKASRPRGRDPW